LYIYTRKYFFDAGTHTINFNRTKAVVSTLVLKMDLQGWTGNFVESDHCNTEGLVHSYDKNGDEIYVHFYSSTFYEHGQDSEYLDLDEGDLLHFDACYTTSKIILG
jgi:hypothetical protein